MLSPCLIPILIPTLITIINRIECCAVHVLRHASSGLMDYGPGSGVSPASGVADVLCAVTSLSVDSNREIIAISLSLSLSLSLVFLFLFDSYRGSCLVAKASS